LQNILKESINLLLMKKKVNFSECKIPFLEDTFGLYEVKNSVFFNKLVAHRHHLSDFERLALLHLQDKFNHNFRGWNEYELSAYFVVPLFGLVNFTTPYFNDFAERTIGAEVGEYELVGKPDGLIAKGKREPKVPFFAFQEYKPQTNPDGDPAGQCLAAMLVGQTLNNSPTMPIYGCYVIGNTWCFMVLEGKAYYQSNAYVPDDEEIFDIYSILQALKHTFLQVFETK
jgi:hypothetical protein